MFKIEMLKSILERTISRSQSTMDDFKAAFDKDPVNALQWADKTYQAAAMAKLYSDLLDRLQAMSDDLHQDFLKKQEAAVLDRVLRAAGDPTRSTSPSTNLMDQYLGSAYVELYDLLTSCQE